MGDDKKPERERSRYRPRGKTVCAGLSLVLGLCLVIGGLLVLFQFRGLVERVIKSRLALKEGEDTTQKWIDPPVTPLIRFYFFNVTNPADFLEGAKPKLVEVGPYTYEQKWMKDNVQWLHDGEAVQYEPKKWFYFRRDLSVGPEHDRFTLPNVPMITSIGGRIRFAGRLVRLALGSMLDILHQKPFIRVSVKDFIWGYESPLVRLGNDILPAEEKLPFNKFGIFTGKNGTAEGVFKVVTGMREVAHVGQVLSFNGKVKLDFWTGRCNDIKGTDGSVFHPGIKRNETLHLFNRRLCQSLPLVYEEDVEANGLPGYRFVPPTSAFATRQQNPDNACFCNNPEGFGCLTPSGLFNLSSCQFNAPLMLSWPHFYQADRRLLNTVEGLAPEKEKHQFFIDILPQLGKPLRAQARTQLNVAMSRVDGINAARGLRDIIFPMVWWADGIDGIEDKESLALLRTAVFTPETARSVMYPILLTLGGSALLASIAFFAKKYFIGRGGIGRSNQWEVDSGGGGAGGRQSGNGDSNGAGRVVESELKAYKNRAFSETGLGGAGTTTVS